MADPELLGHLDNMTTPWRLANGCVKVQHIQCVSSSTQGGKKKKIIRKLKMKGEMLNECAEGGNGNVVTKRSRKRLKFGMTPPSRMGNNPNGSANGAK